MSNWKKSWRFVIGSIAAAGLLAVTGCGSTTGSANNNNTTSTSPNSSTSASGSKNLTIGVLIDGIAMYPYYTRENQGIQDEVKALEKQYGVNITLAVEDTQNNPQTELSDAKNLILKKVQLVLYTPTTFSAGVTIVKQFNQANIPVITMDREAGDSVASYVGYDNVKLGSIMAQIASDYLHGNGVIAEETGALGSANQIARSKGWDETFAKNSGIKVAANQTNNFDPAQAYSITKEILQAHPDVQLIMSQDDSTAIGAASAATAAHKSIPVIGLGASTAGLKAIQNGQLYGTVLMEPYAIGEQATKLAVEKLLGQSIPQTQDPSPYTIITSKNVSDFVNSPEAGW